MNTADRIQALEGAIAAALETLAKAKAAAEGPEPTGPRLATAADGAAATRKRYPGRTRSEVGAGDGTAEGDAPELTGRAAGIEAARRRTARRGGAS